MKNIFLKIGASEHPFMKWIAHALRIPFLFFQYKLLAFQHDKKLVDLIQNVYRERGFSMWPTESALVFLLASKTNALNGDYAEVGVYRGGSAKLICEAKGSKSLHLFDTFEGLPDVHPIDGDALHKTQYREDLSNVQDYLKKYSHVFFYKGIFPDTAGPIRDRKFSFVHLDVDLYTSTLDCLRFFYPRMVRGGIIISHDYSTLEGVKRAFEQFFADKDESVLELSTSQCFVVKLS